MSLLIRLGHDAGPVVQVRVRVGIMLHGFVHNSLCSFKAQVRCRAIQVDTWASSAISARVAGCASNKLIAQRFQLLHANSARSGGGGRRIERLRHNTAGILGETGTGLPQCMEF